MVKIKLVVSATIEETFSDFIISRKTKDLAKLSIPVSSRGTTHGCEDGYCHAPTNLWKVEVT